jgi:hypothetical protein
VNQFPNVKISADQESPVYDHYFLRFLRNFSDKIGFFFLANQLSDPFMPKIFQYFVSKSPNFLQVFRRKIFLNHNIGPRSYMVDGVHFGLPLGDDGGSAAKKTTGTQGPRGAGIRIKNENLGREAKN